MLLAADRSVLVVIDVQERLAPAIHAADRVVRNIGILLQAAQALGVPTLATEQYPKGLGATLPAVAERLPAGCIVEKLCFSCAEEPHFLERLAALGRDQIVLTGMEAHVCVLQTAFGLRARGHACHLVADATSSRQPDSAELGIARMRANGVEVVTTEMVVFEWLHRAGTPAFKEVSRLIK